MIFAYIQSIYERTINWQQINAYTFTPDAAVGSLFQASILFLILHNRIKKWQKSNSFSTKEVFIIFATSLLFYLIVMKVLGFLIALVFDTIRNNFNAETFLFSMFSDFLNGFIYGAFFLAYYYFNKNKIHHQQLANYHKSISESKIYQLKAQLNPHFLFNNLNVLDQLIDEDKHKASDFLNKFADIYRYVLECSDKNIIGLSDELAFAKQYHSLIAYKYGKSYQINIEAKNLHGYIVPLTLQLLIENAVQHNLGTEEDPIIIDLVLNENMCVTNNIKLKHNPKVISGRAIANLKEQYKLLSKSPIEIRHTADTYTVIIPIIKLVHT